VYGQHLAAKSVPEQIRAHIEPLASRKVGERANAHALAMSFHGGAGTGKTYLSTFVQRSLFAGQRFNGHIFAAPEYHDHSKVLFGRGMALGLFMFFFFFFFFFLFFFFFFC